MQLTVGKHIGAAHAPAVLRLMWMFDRRVECVCTNVHAIYTMVVRAQTYSRLSYTYDGSCSCRRQALSACMGRARAPRTPLSVRLTLFAFIMATEWSARRHQNGPNYGRLVRWSVSLKSAARA